MTTVLDSNVHNVAIEGKAISNFLLINKFSASLTIMFQGSFDDCQDTVKALFADPETNSKHKLAAVNSINWARILSQITYYVHSYLTLLRTKALSAKKQVRFVVPSGNFGDMLVRETLPFFCIGCSVAVTKCTPLGRLVCETNGPAS